MARSDVESCSCSGGGKAAAEARIFVIESKTIPLTAIGQKESAGEAGRGGLSRPKPRALTGNPMRGGLRGDALHPCTDGDQVSGVSGAVSRSRKFQALNLTTNRRKSLLWPLRARGRTR